MARDILIPDPLVSDQQYARFYHFDIPSLEDTDLIDELHMLRPLLWWRLPSDPWLRERVKMLEQELAKRRGDAGFEFSGRPKRRLAEGIKL
jgi:hypothetical protein